MYHDCLFRNKSSKQNKYSSDKLNNFNFDVSCSCKVVSKLINSPLQTSGTNLISVYWDATSCGPEVVAHNLWRTTDWPTNGWSTVRNSSPTCVRISNSIHEVLPWTRSCWSSYFPTATVFRCKNKSCCSIRFTATRSVLFSPKASWIIRWIFQFVDSIEVVTNRIGPGNTYCRTVKQGTSSSKLWKVLN